MKFNIKKFMSYLMSVVFLTILINNSKESSAIQFFPVMAATEKDKEEEEFNNFNFIKSEEKVRDFIYDGSVFLYGGILLITISCLGIFFTLKPKKKKKRKKQMTDIKR